MYSIPAYGRMIQDRVRVDSYARALRQNIGSESVVLDIGAGPGIFSFLACQCGAKRVYAIEPDDSIELARRIAAANGLSSRIEFIQDFSTRITLPEKVDVIVSDISGVLPFFQKHIPTIVDARARFLRSSGRLIPASVTLWAGIVEAAELYERHVGPWTRRHYDLDLTPGRQLVTNSWRKSVISPDQLVTRSLQWAALDYSSVEAADVSTELMWKVERDGPAHGIAAWVDTVLSDGVAFSSAPGQPETIYGHAFFPWTAPVDLARGDSVTVRLQADLIGEDYVWQWNTTVQSGNDQTVKATFRQSTLASLPLSPARLRTRAASHIPRLNEEGEIHQLILEHMNGSNTLEEIAASVAKTFPRRFPSIKTALAAVADFSTSYGR